MNTTQIPYNTVPEYHFFMKFHYDWELVFYCHDEDHFFASRKEAAHTYREGKARDFMVRLQRRLGLRKGQMIYFGSTEFGETNKGHLHVLVSFDPLREKRKNWKIIECGEKIQSQVEAVRKEMFGSPVRVGIGAVGESAKDQKKLLSYVCKHENQVVDYKHCFYPRWLLMGGNYSKNS